MKLLSDTNMKSDADANALFEDKVVINLRSTITNLVLFVSGN